MENNIAQLNKTPYEFDKNDKDVIGEINNISMGSGATALSQILNKKVTITTPSVSVIFAKDFKITHLEPAMGVAIKYIDGLYGYNYFIMKKRDIFLIYDILMGNKPGKNQYEIDEIFTSAISETMNQMMGSASTALASFLNKTVNISPPETFMLEDDTSAYKFAYKELDVLVTINFNLEVENILKSEFVSVMTIDFAKNLVRQANDMHFKPIAPKAAPQKDITNVTPLKNIREAQAPVSISPVKFMNLDDVNNNAQSIDPPANFDLIMDVPVEMTVEIGRAKKPIKEILEVTNGTIIELDKQASEPVDIVINGQPIARGEIVVIEDNFGVRITELLRNNTISGMI